MLEKTETSSDGMMWTAVSGTSVTLTGLADGHHIIYVKATDVVSHTYTASVNLTVDTIAPQVVSSSPNGTKESTRVVINATFSEEMDRNASTITVNSIVGNITWNGTIATFKPGSTLIGDKLYDVLVTGQDLAGNQLATTTWTFKTDKVGTVSGTVKYVPNVIYDNVPRMVMIHIFVMDVEKVVDRSPWFAAEASQSERTAMIDDQGRYCFYDVPIGRYTMTVLGGNGKELQSSTFSLTSADVAKGGVSVNMTVNPTDNTPLYIGIILIVAVVVVLLLLVVRRRKKQATAKGKQETPVEESESGRQAKK
jgi:hypothetical protein